MKTKDKVLEVEEVMLKEGISKEKIKRINLKEAFEGCITLAEVGKVIDDMEIEGKGYKIQGNFYYSEESIQKSFRKAKKELKQKLGIK